MENTNSLGNQMFRSVNCINYAVTLTGNAIWNKVRGVADTKDITSYEVEGYLLNV
ncbi:TPA: hypothetical protein ACGOZ6_001442 [Streptococcus suis]|nr:hypothetical protein [Streptococcus suis]